MAEKLTESITFKVTYEEKRDLEAIAKAEKTDVSKLSRAYMKAKIQEVKEYLNSLRELDRLTTDTVDTPFFELTPEPLQKPQAQKKLSCYDQLSLICHPTAKQ
ncbi:hypothetical protein P255_00960 [Acinetobacter brisouii CIP 110357]|uniref:Uncharacterized protein n=1 Tax=Acinetobacter brisouii CIP 110357 TaxID=1341683 RepID=V2UE77_9GAMM|nr:hypothetical protein [Acinetobacter brisouii]ENV46810.1 hypothetical protein F954_02800 [Acinetobacter brisouii ANC 4119]ESK52798.1 hypothetical protein P255_00960 [Acinetobacter brisouii CIP 110357]